MQNEESLVQRAQQHDQMALTQLYEENFVKIYRYIFLRLREKTEAEDMAQQVFMKALRSISSYKSRGAPFSAWLFRIAHNLVVDYIRKKSRYVTVPLDVTLPDNSADPVATAELNIDIERVAAASQKLTRAQQEVLALRFTSGLPIAEVARMMKKTEGAIKALQHSAVLALRRQLGDGVEL